MAKYIVAVSGGVDSVVLLDMLSRQKHQLIVAHVEHGIRGDESVADARFVAALARKYQVPFVSTSLALGPKASEEWARELRYDFLLGLAREHEARVVTAHHLDDVVETVAVNLERGTGWRGLTVLARASLYRPLLALSKTQLYAYALKHRLEWVEDATNAGDQYQRNRLRHKIAMVLPRDTKQRVSELRARQLCLRTDVARESARVLVRNEGSRHFLSVLDDLVAIELLGTAIELQTGIRPTRPQLTRALLAIKTARQGSEYHIGNKLKLQFTVRKYRVAVL
ncbi:MAG: tRNA lysidine(34) synthetase TilS [Candidatus Saccharimonas sp.]